MRESVNEKMMKAPLKNMSFEPDFSKQDTLVFGTPRKDGITPEGIIAHTEELLKRTGHLPHKKVLALLLEKIEPIDFLLKAYPEAAEISVELKAIKVQAEKGEIPETVQERRTALQNQLKKFKLKQAHYLVTSIEELLTLALDYQFGICKHLQFLYLYNGAYWCLLGEEELCSFLGKVAEKQGIDKYTSRFFLFKENLFKQFQASAALPAPDHRRDRVCVNMANGTFQIMDNGAKLREFRREDFLTYQLPFAYDPSAQAPLFKRYLSQVLPDPERQQVLAEFLGYVFIPPGILKLEKALLLYGSGANGKSVFFEVMNALLGGSANVSNYSLMNLTSETGYYRAQIGNMLVNYASEINGKLETSFFKQLVSGEPIEARLPYAPPFILRDYAKLIFNCNELPREVEHTHAYFRRFLIIPFDVSIPEGQQDKTLSRRIIETELSGVFNWVLEGLNRLLTTRQFSPCEAARLQLEQYKEQSDSVKMFLHDGDYLPSPDQFMPLKSLYQDYRQYCLTEGGFHPVNKVNFSQRLTKSGYVVLRRNVGNVVFLVKNI